MTPSLVCATVEVALNRTLRLEPEVLSNLGPLAGRVLGLSLDGLGWDFFIELTPDGTRVLASFERTADVHLHGTPLALGRLATQAARGDNTLPQGVRVDGDTELLNRFRSLLTQVGFDPEELVAKVVGGGAAHRLVGGLKNLLGWGRSTASTLTQDTAEYLREETRDLARKIDADEWMDAVDVLRDGSERLEARIRLLERAAKVGG